MKVLLKPEAFVEILPGIGGNIDLDLYIPSIRVAQELKIKPLLTKPLYKKLEADYVANTLAGSYLELYEDYVQYLIAYAAGEHFVSIHPYKIGNGGIQKVTSDNGESVEKNEVDFLMQNYRNIFEHFKTETYKFLEETRFPEYPINIKKPNNLIGGWYLSSKEEQIRDRGLPRTRYSRNATLDSFDNDCNNC